jgi:hypothetical protein
MYLMKQGTIPIPNITAKKGDQVLHNPQQHKIQNPGRKVWTNQQEKFKNQKLSPL